MQHTKEKFKLNKTRALPNKVAAVANIATLTKETKKLSYFSQKPSSEAKKVEEATTDYVTKLSVKRPNTTRNPH